MSWGYPLLDDEHLGSDFERIQQGERTLYIRRDLVNSRLGRSLSAGKNLHELYELKTIPSAEHARVCKFRVSIDGREREVYLKEYLSSGAFHFIKRLLRGSRARQTLETELMLSRNGFDAPAAIAVLEYRTGLFHGKSMLLTFSIEGAQSVRQFIKEYREGMGNEWPGKKREMIRAFGGTVGKMHAKGIHHGDLQLGNILLRREQDSVRFYFLDNERTRKFGRLPFGLRVKNLVQMNIIPREVLSNTSRMRFFREYCKEAGINRDDGKLLIAAVVKKTGRRRNKRSRIGRDLTEAARTKEGRLVIETSGYKAVFDRDFCDAADLAGFIEKLEWFIRRGEVVKESNGCVETRLKWQGKDIVIRQYYPKGVIHSLRCTIGKSDAEKKWLNGRRDETTPNALGYIERKKWGLVWKSYFVTEYAER